VARCIVAVAAYQASIMIPRDFVDELIDRTDIVAVIDSYVPLRKAGKEYMACCPFHQEKTPSFTVSPDKQFYYCFGCGATGNVISFVMDYAGLDFIQTISELAGRIGIAVPQQPVNERVSGERSKRQRLHELLERITAFYMRQLHQHPFAGEACAYLTKRGLDSSLCEQFQIGFAPPGWSSLLDEFGRDAASREDLQAVGMLSQNEKGLQYDRFRQRIMFPIHDHKGRVIAFGGRIIQYGEPKYLNSPETILFHKGRELYGWHRVRAVRPPVEQVVVVEGYMDVIGLARHGIHHAVATLGTATRSEHIESLFRVVGEVIFCFDGDAAGRKAAWRALETALPWLQDGRKIRFAFLPQGDDPDSFVRKQGAAAFERHLEQAIALSEMLFSQLLARIDIRTLEGQAALVDQAASLIAQVPGQTLRDLLVRRLSELTRLPVQQLQVRIRGATDAPAPLSGNLPRSKQGFVLSPMRTAVGLLAQYPALFAAEPNLVNIPHYDLPGGDLLAALIAFIVARPHLTVTTGMILEQWKNTPHFSALRKLTTWDYLLQDESQIRSEFWDAIVRLEEHQRDHQLDMLLQKASVMELNEQERALLSRLYQQRAEGTRTMH